MNLKRETCNIVSVSGGKDSTAMLLLAIEREVPNLRAVFADTDNEHQITYDYLAYLESATGVKIERYKADFSKRIRKKRHYGLAMWGTDLYDRYTRDVWGRCEPCKGKGVKGSKKKVGKRGFYSEEGSSSGSAVTAAATAGRGRCKARHVPRRGQRECVRSWRHSPAQWCPVACFLTVMIWKGRSVHADLNSSGLFDHVFVPAQNEYGRVVSWQGVRRDESAT